VTRVAAIDCGTNSIRLLIADPAPDGGLVEIDRRLEMVRLGQGVDATGGFHPDALDRTFAAVDAYATLIRDADARSVRFVATSAARDARNRDQFTAGIERRLGVVPEVISGDEEARLSFLGVTAGVPAATRPVLAMDIGGGSTELILGAASGVDVVAAVSLDIGSVRLTERFGPARDGAGDPPEPSAVAAAEAYVDAQLDACGIDLSGVATWFGVAGTVTSVAAISQELPHYDRDRVHGFAIGVAELRRVAHYLRSVPLADLRAIPSLHPQRADVIAFGALIAERVSYRLDVAELVVSESDILDGIALGLLEP